ncbi:MAG: site-specific integrase, partial [Pseudomonadota bacterium]|nr:site-specific integrase [Pseudomonadota bacterium]
EYSVQRLRGGFAVVWYDDAGRRRRNRLSSTTRPGAEAEARKSWQMGDAAPWTTGRVVEAYMSERRASGIASADRQANAWQAMHAFWSGISPSLIDDEMAREYAAGRGKSAATVRYELSMLAVALRWATRQKILPSAPSIWRPKVAVGELRHLDKMQFETFFAGVKAEHARLYALVGLFTMARPTAVLELRWDRVDFDRRLIDLNPVGRVQTAKRRPVVYISDDALVALRGAYEGRQSDFVIERAGQPIKCIKKAFQAASARSGIKATPYSLRHTGAVWAAEAGVPMSELAQYMGHSDSRTTERHYARYSPGYLKGVANAVRRGSPG